MVKRFFKNHMFGILLLGIVIVLFRTNYTPGTYLSGWDSLQTELAPALAIKRAFFSSWQEYQSFGLPAGMGHAADLLRSILLWFASFILPQQIIRYTFTISMVLVAGIGMFKLLEFSGSRNEKRIFAFTGALFYMFNFFVIQMMALPYESFSIFFGCLPWEIWAFLQILTNKTLKKSDWLILAIVSLLSTPQSQALQLFVVLMILLTLISCGRIITTKSLVILKRAVIGFFLIGMINSFWILPQVYFLKTSASVVTSAKANQLTTEDIFYRNKDRGHIEDFLTSTGFFYDGITSNKKLIFEDWKTYRENLPILIVIYFLSGITILGIFVSSQYRIPFLFAYIFILILLVNNTFPFDVINILIRKNSFINQIFRSPFTKFSIPAALVNTYFATYGISFIAEKASFLCKSLQRKRIVRSVVAGVFATLILIQVLPAFTGHFFAQNMKVNIPAPYFQAMDYFKHVDKNKRIGLLPVYTFWGWYNNKWGYDGSGFLWYGIEQPIISNTFDVWNTNSESYFWEIKNAIEAEDLHKFEAVIEKYNVDYFILDHSLNPLVSTPKALSYDEIEYMLSKSSKIKLEKKWGFLWLYSVKHDKPITNFVWGTNTLPNIGPAIQITNSDTAYQKHGDYLTNSKKTYQSYYPFLDITSQTRLDNPEWKLFESSSMWYLTRKLPENIQTVQYSSSSGIYEIPLYIKNQPVEYVMSYTITIQNHIAIVTFPKTPIDTFSGRGAKPELCINRKGAVSPSYEGDAIVIQNSGGDNSCVSFADFTLVQKYGYLVKIKNRNISGQRLDFSILDKTKDQPYVEDRLTKDTEYYIIGDRFNYGLGYSFSFINNSYTTIPSKNELENVEIFLLPYSIIKELSLNQSGLLSTPPTYINISTKKLQYYLYTMDFKKDLPQYIVLNQAYQPGWKLYQVSGINWFSYAFPFLGSHEITNHVTVNNWENGWTMDGVNIANGNRFVIVYLPQYLEYIGFLVLFGVLGWLGFLLVQERK